MTTPLYSPGIFAALDPGRVLVSLQRDGWDPVRIRDPAGHVYPPHSHASSKLLVILSGAMTVTAAGEVVRCSPGDQIAIPGGTEHSAQVGPEGCEFYWSEQVR